MTEGELLQRIAQTLRQEIGPAIDAEYPKTQAFMAGVVLQKLGQQVALARTHELAATTEFETLLADLAHTLSGVNAPRELQQAIVALEKSRNSAALCRVIEALYAARAGLGDTLFTALLSRVRQNLRASIDRRMEFAA
jgi:hypothetical protein